jgi:tripartite-type tricarboxylate transporter receptor subunit TctC
MHLTGELFEAVVQAKLQHVPYRGSAAAMTDLLGGQVQSMFSDFLVALPQIRAGKITALAVSSARRHPLLPDVPTIAESAQAAGVPGLSNFEATSWQGLFAPAGTPREVVQRLNAEVLKALDAPDLKEVFAAQGFIVAGSTPEAFRTWVESEVAKWGRIVRAANVQPD